MEVSFLAAVNVSILAMAVIFIVLTILIFTIQTLVKLIPYEAPTSLPSNVRSEQNDHVAAITATLAMHMGKSPKEFKIVNIS
jgi:Na+-transporting methylmalonyl-CoA/oxaloacetate decarboxylase gamma subunit